MFKKFEKVTIQWIKLSTFRATDPRIILTCAFSLQRPEEELKELKDEVNQKDMEVKQLQKESTYTNYLN